MKDHRWTNVHDAKCPVSVSRRNLLADLAKDPTNRYLLGAVPEYDHGGDQEVELCECFAYGRPDLVLGSKEEAEAYAVFSREHGGPFHSTAVALEHAEEAGALAGTSALGTRGQDLVLVAAARLISQNPNGCLDRFASLLEAVQETEGVAVPYRLRLYRNAWDGSEGGKLREVAPDWRHHYSSSRALARGEKEHRSDTEIVTTETLDCTDPKGILSYPGCHLRVDEVESPNGAYCVRLTGSRGVVRHVLLEQWGYDGNFGTPEEAEERIGPYRSAEEPDVLGSWVAPQSEELAESQRPFDVAVAVAQGKREILEDVASGRIPADAASFSVLHDHVDANEYGGLCDERAEWTNEQAAAVQDALDRWIRDGGIGAGA